MIDYFSKLKGTRGLWLFLFGVALVLSAPLPLKFVVLNSGTQGNPIGFGLIYVAGSCVGAITVAIGCLSFTIEILSRSGLKFSLRLIGYVALSAVIAIFTFILGLYYQDLIAGVGPLGSKQTEVFAKRLGLSEPPPGFRYSDISYDGNQSQFNLVDATGFGALTVTISPQSGPAAAASSCATDLTAQSVKTRAFSIPVGVGRKSHRNGAEQTLTFFASNRSYSLSTQAIDAAETMAGHYKWKEPAVHLVPVDVMLNVAKQLCYGAAEPKTGSVTP